MTYFKLDIPKVSESIVLYNKQKKQCLDDINLIYKSLEYTDSAWNDKNAYVFIEKVKKDKYELDEYFDYLDKLYIQIRQFKDNIDMLCSRQGYSRNSVVFKFDDSSINYCNKYLNNALYYLNSALNNINTNDFPESFEYMWYVYELINEINSVTNNINSLIQTINDFVKSVNYEISNSKSKLKKINKFNFILKKVNYICNIVDMGTKSIEKEKIKSSFNNTKTKEINLEQYKEINGISNNIQNVYKNKTEINYNELKEIKGLNDGINQADFVQKRINLNETKSIEGLHNNTKDVYQNTKEINIEESKKVEELNKDVREVSGVQKTLDSHKSQLIEGIGNNIDKHNTKDSNITFNNVYNLDNLTKDVDQAKITDNSIIFDSSKKSNLNLNIEKHEATVNDINYDINNNIDIFNASTIVEPNQINFNSSNNFSNILETNVYKPENIKKNMDINNP